MKSTYFSRYTGKSEVKLLSQNKNKNDCRESSRKSIKMHALNKIFYKFNRRFEVIFSCIYIIMLYCPISTNKNRAT